MFEKELYSGIANVTGLENREYGHRDPSRTV
jgi:hypothetical protein